MAVSSSLHNSRFTEDSLGSAVDVSNSIHDVTASDLEATLADLRAKLEAVRFDNDAFLNQITDQARQLTQANSTLVALGQGETIACVARSGSLGPALGTPIDRRSGISGECLRRGLALMCTDTDTDSRVDAEACRRLGIRSLVVVPVVDRSEVVGLVEAFSSSAYAFQDQHVPTLEKLASLIAESRSRVSAEASQPLQQTSAVPPKSHVQPILVPVAASGAERRSKWIQAFRLRPYQIAIVIAFLLLDLGILYWWHQR